MKKTLIAASVIVVLGAGYTLAAWYTGNIIAKNIDSKIAQITHEINQYQSQEQITITYRDYQQGLFATSFHLTVNRQASAEKQLALFDDTITIYHGPLPWSELKSGDFAPQMAALVYQTSQASNQQLWQAAGDKAFITVNARIDYSGNITILAHNEPLNYSDETLGISWQTTANRLTIAMNSQLNHLDMKSNIDQLRFKNPHNTWQVNNLTFTSQVMKQPDQGYKANSELSLEKGIWQPTLTDSAADTTANTDTLKINQLVIDLNLSQPHANVDGHLSASVNSLFFGRQNLGKGELLANYTLPMTQSAVMDTTDQPAAQNWLLKLDKLLWQNQQGNLSANFTLNIDPKQQPFAQLDQDNLLFAAAKVRLPLRALAYLTAQITNPAKSMPDDNDISNATSSVILLGSLLFNHSPIVDFNYDPTDDIDDGVAVDLYYSAEQNQARLKGKSVTLGQFWQALDTNTLPHL